MKNVRYGNRTDDFAGLFTSSNLTDQAGVLPLWHKAEAIIAAHDIAHAGEG